MKPPQPGKRAPVGLRALIYGLSILLTFLFVWLFGFVLADIGGLDGPDYEEIESRYVAPGLLESQEDLGRQIRELETAIARQREIQQTLRQSVDTARATMQQMVELRRLSLEQGVPATETEQQALADSQARFLDAQGQLEQANQEIATLSQSRFVLGQELDGVREELEEQREPARAAYRQASRRHEFKVATLKLAFIVPFFVLAAGFVYRQRESLYRPIFLAVLLASSWKVGVVMFHHFPREFFKYIAIAAAIGAVLAFLVWLLRRARKPGFHILLKRFREAYSTHRCPICAYPIARGFLRHAIWTGKGPRLASAVAPAPEHPDDSPYACPSCGTTLFEKCPACALTRHSLLPFCEHCGDERDVPELRAHA